MSKNRTKGLKILSNNLNNLLSTQGKTMSDVAHDTGISYTTLRNWFLGIKFPRQQYIDQLAHYFGVSRDNLIMEKKATNTVSGVAIVPVIGTIACGSPILAQQNIEEYREELSSYIPSNAEVFFLKCKGNSMEPTIPNGSYVLIEKQPDVEDGQIAAVMFNNDSEVTLKRIIHQEEQLILQPDNSDYKPIIANKNNPATILGRAIRMNINM